MKAISTTVNGSPIGYAVPLGGTNYVAGAHTVNGITAGKVYYWADGANDTSISNGTNTITTSGFIVALGTSFALVGTGTSAITCTITELSHLYPVSGGVTPLYPTRNVTMGQYSASNPNFVRQVQVSSEYVFAKKGTYAVAIPLADIINLALTQEINLTWTPPKILTSPADTTAAAAASATAVLTSDNTAPANNDTVTIGTKTYTFKSALTPTEGEIYIGTGGGALTADQCMTNLISAINHTGTPDTDYKCAAANTDVTAGTLSAHAFTVTAITPGVTGNLIAKSESSSHLDWDGAGAYLTGGTNSAVTFTMTAGSEYDLTYQWQYDNSGTWTNLTAATINGVTYSDVTTATLALAIVTGAQDGVRHRCKVTDNASSFGVASNGVSYTNSAVLTIA